MKLPRIAGTIGRRLLVNFALDAQLASDIVPEPFRPKLVHGQGVAGICLIRLTHVRPLGLPESVGVTSENAAHRIAVTWDEHGRTREGVFIPRRDTSSRVNSMLGGRIFPGAQHHASFSADEIPPEYRVAYDSDDGHTHVSVSARVANELPEGSIFSSLEEASRFFEDGPVGYSVARHEGRYDGLELDTQSWSIRPLDVTEVRSSFFDALPEGAAKFDSALIMRGIQHEWRALAPICVAEKA